MAIYCDDDVELTAFGIDGYQLYSIDCTACSSLQMLRVTNAGIYAINLDRNKCLTQLNLSGNNLSSFKLTGLSEYFNKNYLAVLNLSNN